ncbi:MAG: hypothetical protein JW839_16980 [Candidatus Lokiarchaeota archaeon]|nr:hypothetical protein [Candidatus Lokiarchaeota archaeon]
MATTIQISDEVQKRLFTFMNQKERELGHRLTYNDAIELLLENQIEHIGKDEFIKHVEKYQGIIDYNGAKKARNEERQLEREREREQALQH